MRGGKETILLAEDDPVLCASVHRALGRLGYNVLEARSGNRALELWKRNSHHVDLLLTDMVMPGGMTGKELGLLIHKENPKLKVVYMSGYSAEIAGRDFPLEEGFNFLVKPFHIEKLAATIRARLDR
jgi:DNA-binding NtrC family response regulator